MKSPNGYGSISKMSGNRRNPYRVRITQDWVIDNTTGKTKQKQVTLGYYPTRKEATLALAEYNLDPYDIKAKQITLGEVYEKWSDMRFPQLKDVRGYKAAWLLLEDISNKPLTEITLLQLQDIADNSGKNRPTLKNYKALVRSLYDYAIKHDFITSDRDKSKYLDISKAGNPNAYDRNPFSTAQIRRLWSGTDTNEYVSVVLMLIYCGCRISELLDLKKCDINLEERYFNVLESKTSAGIRTVPIAQKVLPMFEYWYNKNNCEYLLSTPEGEHFGYRNYFDSYWKPIVNAFGMEKFTPHCTRHTCISLLTAAGVDERVLQKIVGHKGQNVTRAVYTHLEIREFITAIDKIDAVVFNVE